MLQTSALKLWQHGGGCLTLQIVQSQELDTIGLDLLLKCIAYRFLVRQCFVVGRGLSFGAHLQVVDEAEFGFWFFSLLGEHFLILNACIRYFK